MRSVRAGAGHEHLCPAGARHAAGAWESLREGKEEGKSEQIWQDQEVCEDRKSVRESRQILGNLRGNHSTHGPAWRGRSLQWRAQNEAPAPRAEKESAEKQETGGLVQTRRCADALRTASF